jgi:uncharacterized protein (DUF924 family)
MKEVDNIYTNLILKYWFSNGFDEKRWFQEGSKNDTIITRYFKKILKEAEKGNLLHWLEYDSSYLAYIILLDQFSRHIYRGTKNAYKNDTKALRFTEMGLDLHLDKFNAMEKMFVLMPYQHSEEFDDQKLGVKILTELVNKEKNIEEKNILKKALFHQKNHLNVIKKFKRFPKRNDDLGRESTEEEIDYMDENTKYPY